MRRAAAEARFRAIRELAYRDAEAKLIGVLPAPLKIRAIDPQALAAFRDMWCSHALRRVDWPWPNMANDYRRGHADRFEMSAWSGSTLCGLAVGRPSHSRAVLTVHYIEGNPDVRHPLKNFVHVAALEAAHSYAVAIGVKYLRLAEPFPGVLPMYALLGFRLVNPAKGAPYCEREV